MLNQILKHIKPGMSILNFEISSPESQGFSSEKLMLLNEVMHSFVDNNELSAIQTAIVKNGKLIHFDSYGSSDISENDSLESDDIFRIASMTKPIVSIGLMMLLKSSSFPRSLGRVLGTLIKGEFSTPLIILLIV